MNTNQKILVGLTLALFVPALALAQSDLILPQSAEDFRQLGMKSNTEPCVRCGIVTDIFAQSREIAPNDSPSALPASGVGNSIGTTPILGSGTTVKDARNANKPTTFFKATVRFDDGTYAFFEMDDKQGLRKGDKVEVVEGKLEARLD